MQSLNGERLKKWTLFSLSVMYLPKNQTFVFFLGFKKSGRYIEV